VLGADVGKLVLLPVPPDVFHRIKFRSVARQVLGLDVAVGVADELLYERATMCRQTVPNDQQRTMNVTHQRLEEVDHLGSADPLGIEPEVEVAKGDAGGRRKLLPIEVECQNGRLSARRPSAAAIRLQAQSAFIDEDDRALLCLGFFLRAGQVVRFHVRIAFSLRSRAFPTGRCGLQLSACSNFQTWPSW